MAISKIMDFEKTQVFNTTEENTNEILTMGWLGCSCFIAGVVAGAGLGAAGACGAGLGDAAAATPGTPAPATPAVPPRGLRPR